MLNALCDQDIVSVEPLQQGQEGLWPSWPSSGGMKNDSSERRKVESRRRYFTAVHVPRGILGLGLLGFWFFCCTGFELRALCLIHGAPPLEPSPGPFLL
jgi:hypothetical protein